VGGPGGLYLFDFLTDIASPVIRGCRTGAVFLALDYQARSPHQRRPCGRSSALPTR